MAEAGLSASLRSTGRTGCSCTILCGRERPSKRIQPTLPLLITGKYDTSVQPRASRPRRKPITQYAIAPRLTKVQSGNEVLNISANENKPLTTNASRKQTKLPTSNSQPIPLYISLQNSLSCSPPSFWLIKTTSLLGVKVLYFFCLK